MPSLSELRKDPRPARRAERALTICLAPDLVAEVQALTDELGSLAVAGIRSRDPEEPGPPSRMGDGEDPRADEIRVRLAELLDEMAREEGELRVRAIDDGDWRRWVNEHPARPEGTPGHDRDAEVTAGYCDADALLDDLERYAWTWDGEPLAPGEWNSLLVDKIAAPDKKAIATAVVSMHERSMDLGKWRAGLSAMLKRSPVAGPPAPSADPRPSTSAESQPSDTSTTTPTTS